MAKRKKSKGGKRKTGRRSKRGMGAMAPGSATKKAVLLLTTIAASQLAEEGMQFLYDTDFMKVTVKDGETAPKINIKKAGASGGALLAAGLGATMVKNEWINAASTGIAVTASSFLKNDLINALGMGAVSDFLNLYKKGTKTGTSGIKGPDPLSLAGDNQPISFA